MLLDLLLPDPAAEGSGVHAVSVFDQSGTPPFSGSLLDEVVVVWQLILKSKSPRSSIIQKYKKYILYYEFNNYK